MLSSIFSMLFKHKKEAKECYGLDNLDDDVIGYPPNPKGIPVVQPSVLIGRMQKEINFIRNELGMSYEDFDRLIEPAMHNFIQYADLIPASEYKHHSTGGGLVYHSFDVAKRAMRMAQHTQFPIGIGTVADTQRSNIQWKTGTVLAALMHDGGKILADVEISNGAEKNDDLIIWDAHKEQTLYEWASEHKIERYFIKWLKGRHMKHQNASLMVMQRLIPQDAWSWLGGCYDGHDVHAAMLASVAKSTIDHPMTKIVAEADSESARRDIFARNSHITKEIKQVPLSELLCDLMKHYVLTNKWLVNAGNAPVWYVNGELYVVWPVAVPQLFEAMIEAGYRIPDVPKVLARVMIEEGQAIKNGEDVLFDLYPEILGNDKKAVKLECLKIRNVERIVIEPDKLYSLKEHPKKPKEKEVAEMIFDDDYYDEAEHNDVDVEHASKQVIYESSEETLNRVLALMKCQEVEGEQSTQSDHEIVETEHETSIGSESEPSTVDKVVSAMNFQSALPPEFTCAVARFIHQKFGFDIEQGKVVIPAREVFNIEKALLDSGVEGLTRFNVHSLLRTSKEISIHE